MKRILIADASKASLVMTSEVFKDHFPGVQVVVARSSSEAIELAKTCGEVDAFIIDFDLPDRDGAYTAAKIKKFSATPILITGFDKEEVHKTIEQELAAYDDCLNWIKKPVKADLVVNVAQRFIEGKYRCQRRIACAVPALLEATVVVTTLAPAPLSPAAKKKEAEAAKALAAAASADASKNTKKGAKSAKATHEEVAVFASKAPALIETKIEMRLLLPVVLEDSSVGGVKIKVAKKPLPSFSSAGSNAISTEWNLKVEDASTLTLVMPSIEEIAAGPAALEAWQTSRLQALVEANEKAIPGKGSVPTKAKGKSTATLSALQSKTEQSVDSKKTAAPTQTLKGKVAWQATHDDGAVIGLQGDNPNNTKKLFETLIDLHQKECAGKAVAAEQAAALAALVASQAKDQRSRSRSRGH